MKWTVLSDNRSCDDSLETEHGLSILLETDKHHILLDTGASDVFIRNAGKMGIDLSTVDYVFISHGHNDHAGGLKHLMKINDKAQVIVSPDAMSGKFFSKRGNLHSITAEWPKIDDNRLILIDQTCELAEDIHVIAHIPQIHPIPKGNQNLYVQNTNSELTEQREPFELVQKWPSRDRGTRSQYIHDDFRHELALYTNGLLFTGCAHSGLENILAACPYPIHMVVGGFHLLDDMESEKELTALAQRLLGYENSSPYGEKPEEGLQFYTSHCTGDKVFAILKTVMGDYLHAFSCGYRREETTRTEITP